MKLLEIIKNAAHALLQNRRRSILTMIGIVIGISSVISVLSLGNGFEKYTIESLTQSTDKTVSVKIDFEPSSMGESGPEVKEAFSSVDLSLAKTISGVVVAKIPKEDISMLFLDVEMIGKTLNKMVATVEGAGSEVILGRSLSAFDNQQKHRVAVISEETASSISENFDEVIGQRVMLNGFVYQIVGIMSPSIDQGVEWNGDIEIPRESYVFYNSSESQNNYQMEIQVDPNYVPSQVANEVIDLLTEEGTNRSLGSYSTFDMSDLTDGIGKVLSMLTLSISGIAAISLLIAGVGVMNMMYTSVAERTKEIGIRRAVGATQKDIRNQFLTEGLILTISSGLIGYVIGFLMAYLISQFLPFRVSPDLSTILIAFGVTTFIGLVFSIMPANQAAKKDLVEILR